MLQATPFVLLVTLRFGLISARRRQQSSSFLIFIPHESVDYFYVPSIFWAVLS
jgi:hypothetical protein